MVWGLTQRLPNVSLTLAVPSRCAELFHDQRVDLALLPIGALQEQTHARVLEGYCIGARGAVESVGIYAHRPIEQVRRIYLDPDSRTSTLLTRILLARYWGLQPELVPLSPLFLEQKRCEQEEAVLLIGDKVFAYRDHYEYAYDLGLAWNAYAGLPMVFAVWVTHQMTETPWLNDFLQALAYGVEHIPLAIQDYPLPHPISSQHAIEYLSQRIDYHFDQGKQAALQRFQEEVRRLPDSAPIPFHSTMLCQ